jgi:dolichol-phosphate mannosyltransferase
MKTKISFIVPCYYNEENIPVTFQKLIENESNFDGSVEFEYVFVDDGSKDGTWNSLQKIKSLAGEKVRILRLGKNVGSYVAITAGMKAATGDATVVIAADLQDPVELTVEMHKLWKTGVKLVIGQRKGNKDSFVPRFTSSLFNKMMRKYAINNLPKGGFDFVFFDKSIREEVVHINEKNTNILYLMFSLGYPTALLPYVRQEREIGKSRWTIKKKMKLFIDSFIAFSFVPIRFLSLIGILLGLGSLIYAIYIVISKLTGSIELEGWSALMTTILFIGSFQMIGLGVLGEYLWRILDEVRNRPQYNVIDEK